MSGPVFQSDPFFGMSEPVDVGVEGEERVRVQQSTEELPLNFRDAGGVEQLRFPRGARHHQVPAGGVCAVLGDYLERIHRIAAGLGHLLSLLVQHHLVDDDVLERRLFEQVRADRMQGVEPPPGLVDSFRDEVGREGMFEDVFVLERVVPLGKRHRPRVEPDIDDLRYARHRASALALESHLIHVRLVEVERIRQVLSFAPEFLQAPDGAVLVAVAADPNRYRCTPVAIA